MKTIIKIFVFIFFFLFENVYPQLYFPVGQLTPGDFRSTDYYSSAFGPRNMGTQEYPESNYDYDFHGGIDIVAPEGWFVFPVCWGKVKQWGSVYQSGTQGGEWIEIEHEDSYGKFLVRYMHITIASGFHLWE